MDGHHIQGLQVKHGVHTEYVIVVLLRFEPVELIVVGGCSLSVCMRWNLGSASSLNLSSGSASSLKSAFGFELAFVFGMKRVMMMVECGQSCNKHLNCKCAMVDLQL